MRIVAACTLKLQAMNPSFIKKQRQWYNVQETDLSVNLMKYRLDFLFSVNVNLHDYSTLHG